jgi:hypothetical protein
LAFVATVEQVALQMVDADGLLKAAFGLSFQRKHTSAFDEENKNKLAGVRQVITLSLFACAALSPHVPAHHSVSRSTSHW